MATIESHVFEKHLGGGARGHQPIASPVLARSSLLAGERVQMRRVLHLSTSFPAPHMRRDLVGTVQNPHLGLGRDERQRLANERVRDRVVVAVESHVRRLAGAYRLDVIARESMRRQGEKAVALLGCEHVGDRARIVGTMRTCVRDALDPKDR